MSFLHSRFQKLVIALLPILVVALPAIVSANPKIRVTVGQSVTQKLDSKVKTVSIADSDVADVVVAGPYEVLINGKRIGLTTLVVWDENNVSSIFDVVVRGPFSDLKIELRVQLAEVNRTKATELGFDFFGITDVDGDDQLAVGSYGGRVATPTVPLSMFSGAPTQGASLAFQYVTGDKALQSVVHAMMSNGVLHVLAEPNVVAASGQEAEFLSGGELPIPVAVSGTGGGTTVTIEWKEFGVKVKFVPTIVDSNVVNLQIAPEVSTLDYGNGIQLSGFTLPALRTRRAKTTVELRDQETLVIGGLLMEEEENVRTRIPILGHIPILGYLFSDVRKIKTNTELMLVVSPHIVRALAPGTSVKLPDIEEE
ncbi:MAG: pilus assembly protein N-terminal domain-containing protein [Gemmatimonadales bacterium]|nr:pilus assembly protein N-terminal domain-containing protein [Gemmatimonadales bacterium]